MCLYPKILPNQKYRKTKKNGGHPPPCFDNRVQYIAAGCGRCMECRKQRARGYMVRLCEDIKEHRNGHFVTLTLSTEALKWLTEKAHDQNEERIRQHYKNEDTHKRPKLLRGYTLDNEIATVAVRYFLERWRRKYKKSLRHFLVTELGHQNTEHVHLHGIVWCDDHKEIERIWNNGQVKFGYVWDGYTKNGKRINYVNEKTINYTCKYIYKQDPIHKEYQAVVLASPGIGKAYLKTMAAKQNQYSFIEETNDAYRTGTGHKLALPQYLRNHIYTETQREALWLEKLDKQIRYVDGQKIDISKGMKQYHKALDAAQEKNKRLGYGEGKKDWKRLKYETEHRELLRQKRMQQ